ncbi:MAG: hypothetical protein PUF92_01890 [Subdoligranulum variabile]|nr:hypothetical protein [Subdoligranulum variabile]
MATKQNNFYLQYQQAAKAGKTSARNAFLRKAAPGIIIVAGCLLAWGGVVVHTALMRGQASDLRAWCADEQNLTSYQQSLQDQQAADTYHRLADYANGVSALLDSYPDLTSSLLNRIDAAGSSSGITVEFTSYDAATGVLQFNATSDTVIDIPAYVRALQSCGVFSGVDYTGYQSTNNQGGPAGYALNLRCVLAAPE